MKNVFIINPAAGKTNAVKSLSQEISQAAEKLNADFEIAVTKEPNDARRLVKIYAENEEQVHIFSCGGDGTLNEIIQEAVGNSNLAVGCIPCGTGNDFIRSFGTKADFENINAQLCSKPIEIDCMKTSLGYSASVCAIGLDAQVAYGIPKFRRLPFCGGSVAYFLSILQTVFSDFKHYVRVTLDGKEIKGNYMMAAICNGRYYGGGFCAAPYAVMDDGLLDVILVKPIPRSKLPAFLPDYKNGKHLLNDKAVVEKFRPYMEFYRVKKFALEVLDNKPMIATLDGECKPLMQLSVEHSDEKLNFLAPQNLWSREKKIKWAMMGKYED